jgi:hypothetical protein
VREPGPGSTLSPPSAWTCDPIKGTRSAPGARSAGAASSPWPPAGLTAIVVPAVADTGRHAGHLLGRGWQPSQPPH